MKMLSFFCMLSLVIAQVPSTALAADHEMREDIDKDTPLAEAINRANQQFHDFFGAELSEQEYPPLTEEEVVAAVMAIKAKQPEIKDPVLRIYQRIIEERVLPRGMYFGWTTGYAPGPDLTVFVKVDWRDLILMPLPIGSEDSEIGRGYGYRVRDKFVRPFTKPETIQSLRSHAAVVAGFLESEPDFPATTEWYREALEQAKAALRQLGEDPEPQPGGIKVTIRPRP